jgi:formylglycine-generating enzyme
MNASKGRVSVGVLVGLLAGMALGLNMETVPVGDPGNVGELSGGSAGDVPARICGSVGYTYNIGKYEVTAAQYTEFLNAVAKTDPYGLYDTGMDSAASAYACNIERSGSSGSYTYSVASEYANRPVNHVSHWDACRFANWLHNGQPTGAQGPTTTERGAYTLGGYNGTDGRTIQRDANWKWALTSEDEWYKAAYYKGGSTNAGYWDYPTRSNAAPGQDMADGSGNNANYSNSYGYPIDSGKYFTTVVGEFQNSVSPYGTFDQGGNVYERNESVLSGSGRGLRGGCYGTAWGTLFASYRYLMDPSYTTPTWEAYWIGFRVVQVPEPCSAALLLLACLLLGKRCSRVAQL